jgi:sulfonate transport system permease protein
MAANVRAATITGLDSLELGPPPEDGTGTAARLWLSIWPKALALLLAAGAWEAVCVAGWKKGVLPGPASVTWRLWGMAHHALLWRAAGTTLRQAALGFALGAGTGVAAGMLAAKATPLRAAARPAITALAAMPAVVWVPLAVLLFGAGTPAVVWVAALGAAPAAASAFTGGTASAPPVLRRAGKAMGLSRAALWWHLALPASLPSFLAALRRAWSFAWRSMLAGELLVTVTGQRSLGTLLATGQRRGDTAAVLAVMIVILVLGVLTDVAFGTADEAVRRRRGMAGPASA